MEKFRVKFKVRLFDQENSGSELDKEIIRVRVDYPSASIKDALDKYINQNFMESIWKEPINNFKLFPLEKSWSYPEVVEKSPWKVFIENYSKEYICLNVFNGTDFLCYNPLAKNEGKENELTLIKLNENIVSAIFISSE